MTKLINVKYNSISRYAVFKLRKLTGRLDNKVYDVMIDYYQQIHRYKVLYRNDNAIYLNVTSGSNMFGVLKYE